MECGEEPDGGREGEGLLDVDVEAVEVVFCNQISQWVVVFVELVM